MQSIRNRRHSAALCTAGAALGLAAFAPAAWAGTAQVSGGQFSYVAAAGEKNDLKLTQTRANGIEVREKSGLSITPGPGCEQFRPQVAGPPDPITGAPTTQPGAPDPSAVVCAEAGVASGTVDLGDRSDIVMAFGTDMALTVFGREGEDNLQGGDNDDVIWGGLGNDFMDGNGGADTLQGEDGNDRFRSNGSTPDTLICGAGLDTYQVDPDDILDASCERPPDPVSAGTSNNPASTVRPQDISRGVLPNTALPRQSREACENEIFGTQNADRRLVGTDDGDMIFGLGGADIMNGMEEDDCLMGGEGNDRQTGGSGNDRLEGEAGSDNLMGSAGSDGLLGAAGNDRMDGGTGNDVLDGSAGRDRLSGGAGNDVLAGGAGNDTITAGAGRNVIGAGSGNDVVNSVNRKRETVNCGSGRDRVRADRIDRLVGCERATRVR
jgi:Ca2+-binding RTX toxin-like protein